MTIITLNPETMLVQTEGNTFDMEVMTVRLENGLEAIIERDPNTKVGDTVYVYTLEDLKGFISTPTEPAKMMYEQEVKIVSIEDSVSRLPLIEGCMFVYQIAHTYGSGHNYTLCASLRNPFEFTSSIPSYNIEKNGVKWFVAREGIPLGDKRDLAKALVIILKDLGYEKRPAFYIVDEILDNSITVEGAIKALASKLEIKINVFL